MLIIFVHSQSYILLTKIGSVIALDILTSYNLVLAIYKANSLTLISSYGSAVNNE